MQIYLPIAEMSVNFFLPILLGGVTGILAGMFGVGGGFLLTPFLMFMGIAPPVAVATSANQIIASSLSGFLTHWRRQNVDLRMGCVLLAGGMIGSSLGVLLFMWLKQEGLVDLLITLCYVFFLGSIGIIMARDSVLALLRHTTHGSARSPVPLGARWLWPMNFPKSELSISVLLPLLIGFCVGVLVSIMGIGGGFLLIPAMIYLLRMPASIVVGTSLFLIIFITANITLLHAVTTHTVDIVLALLLLTGSVVGAQIGIRLAGKLPAHYLRAALALVVLLVAFKLGYGLFATPDDIFSLGME